MEGSTAEGETWSMVPSKEVICDSSKVLKNCVRETPMKTNIPTKMASPDVDAISVGVNQSSVFEERLCHEPAERCHYDDRAIGGKRSAPNTERENLASSSGTGSLSFSKNEAPSSKSMPVEHEKLGPYMISSHKIKNEGVILDKISAEIHIKSNKAIYNDHAINTLEDKMNTAHINRRRDDWEIPVSEGPIRMAMKQKALQKVEDMIPGDSLTKQGNLSSSKSGNLHRRRELTSSCLHDVCGGGETSDESQSLCSPRLKLQPAKSRRNVDSSSAGYKFNKEACSPDDVDDKTHVHKVLDEKSFADRKSHLSVESADSTEGKGNQPSGPRVLNPDALVANVKQETDMCKEEQEIVRWSNMAQGDKEPLRKRVANSENQKNPCTSSTETSLLREVWGESAEVVTREGKPACKRRRLMGRPAGKKNRSLGVKDAANHVVHEVAQGSSLKTESVTISQEASGSLESPRSKDGPDMDGWQQMERLSGDSRYEKSEVGSYGDGNEDVSPMSRRTRREPKVSRKLIPLLESLRRICSHRCGHFFRHNQEPLENKLYYEIIRSPIDLGMIRTRLEEGHYSGSMHFFRDLLLMVSNALVYYSRDTSESAAAFGLRECILQEMSHVFETEALVKQEGPSFRKRDSRQLPGHGRRKGAAKMLTSMDRAERVSRERGRSSKRSDPSINVEGHRMNHQSSINRLFEGGRSDKSLETLRGMGSNSCKNGESFGHKKLANDLTPAETSTGAKLVIASSNRSSEMDEHLTLASMSTKTHARKESSSCQSSMHLSKDVSMKDKSLASESAVERRHGPINVVSTSKASSFPSQGGKEAANHKAKVVINTDQQPVKRGVGRPPKHSQQQGFIKAREAAEAADSSRKRGRKGT
ncbi:hypothetical protein KP509_07G030800 [Ceratopteris richardii]|nr:hypothetical protein KP509_07G030800 [Ceratopteris richardii]KAH7432616.1 hypothetical protein KP509_07G030800 [Ceratopteris richardii]